MFRRQVGLACPSSAPVVGLLPVISSPVPSPNTTRSRPTWTVVTGTEASAKSCHWAAAPGEPIGELVVADRHITRVSPRLVQRLTVCGLEPQRLTPCGAQRGQNSVAKCSPGQPRACYGANSSRCHAQLSKCPLTRTLESRRSLRSLTPPVSTILHDLRSTT